jgi:hypothetical protein
VKALARLFLLLLVTGFASCREGDTVVLFIPISQAPFGNSGCDGPNQTFAAKVVLVTDAAIGPMSQLAAAKTTNTLYLTGAGATVWELDLDAAMPALAPVIGAGVLDAELAGQGIATPAELSGLAVATTTSLVAVEHTSNTIIQVDLSPPASVNLGVGMLNETPGFVNGRIDVARFSFPSGRPLQLVPSGEGSLWVADAGNHVIRRVVLDPNFVFNSTVVTPAGTGVAGHMDGSLQNVSFDTPVGISIACSGELLVSTVGTDGNRVLSLALGEGSFGGGQQGTATTLAGDGMDATLQGTGELASLGQPVNPVASTGGEVYWVDSSTGILRRLTLATGLVDCPLNPGCNTNGTDFSGPGNYAVAVGMNGKLYVLDGVAGTICQVVL